MLLKLVNVMNNWISRFNVNCYPIVQKSVWQTSLIDKTDSWVEWHLLEATFVQTTFVQSQSIGNLSWLNLTFVQGSPSLLPFPLT
jgi:hypothetical protein